MTSRSKRKGCFKRFGFFLFLVIGIGLLLPQNLKMPVEGATQADYNKNSFWYYPWGKSGTHKGVDIFAKSGTPIKASVKGLVLSTGTLGMGGKYVLILGPKWRLHYFAHLQEITAQPMDWADYKYQIGTVGTSGNAKGKAPHVHYSIVTLLPYFWRMDSDIQGWKKMFYLNPIFYLR